jgi:hypothetical protein
MSPSKNAGDLEKFYFQSRNMNHRCHRIVHPVAIKKLFSIKILASDVSRMSLCNETAEIASEIESFFEANTTLLNWSCYG